MAVATGIFAGDPDQGVAARGRYMLTDPDRPSAYQLQFEAMQNGPFMAALDAQVRQCLMQDSHGQPVPESLVSLIRNDALRMACGPANADALLAGLKNPQTQQIQVFAQQALNAHKDAEKYDPAKSFANVHYSQVPPHFLTRSMAKALGIPFDGDARSALLPPIYVGGNSSEDNGAYAGNVMSAGYDVDGDGRIESGESGRGGYDVYADDGWSGSSGPSSTYPFGDPYRQPGIYDDDDFATAKYDNAGGYDDYSGVGKTPEGDASSLYGNSALDKLTSNPDKDNPYKYINQVPKNGAPGEWSRTLAEQNQKNVAAMEAERTQLQDMMRDGMGDERTTQRLAELDKKIQAAPTYTAVTPAMYARVPFYNMGINPDTKEGREKLDAKLNALEKSGKPEDLQAAQELRKKMDGLAPKKEGPQASVTVGRVAAVDAQKNIEKGEKFAKLAGDVEALKEKAKSDPDAQNALAAKEKELAQQPNSTVVTPAMRAQMRKLMSAPPEGKAGDEKPSEPKTGEQTPIAVKGVSSSRFAGLAGKGPSTEELRAKLAAKPSETKAPEATAAPAATEVAKVDPHKEAAKGTDIKNKKTAAARLAAGMSAV